MATVNPQAQIQAALMPAALPQDIVPVTTKNRQVQYTQYNPAAVEAYKNAFGKVAPRASAAELIANALAGMPDAPSYTGAYGTQTINPVVSGLANALQGFGGVYGARKQQEREYLTDMLRAEQEMARIQMEMGKKNITESEENGVMKVNRDMNSANIAEKFAPEKIAYLKELNDKAGRFATDWLKNVSDMANTETSQAYNELEGLVKQYIQPELRKIYGADFAEAEGERFFKAAGLSYNLDSETRWQLIENALSDIARKNGLEMPQITEQNSNISQPTSVSIGQIINGYKFLGGDPNDQKNWEKQQ